VDALPSGHAERRIVTVLFADLVDSTAVAERLDPEDWAELAGEALGAMAAATERYGGAVARLMGDGILALFGAPVASEDDAERAVRAGLDMTRLGPDLRARAAAIGVPLRSEQLQVRVGIATGYVVAGTVGSGRASEYTVLGDPANLAARLEKLAPPGGVLIGPVTRRAVGDKLDVEARPGLVVKGKQETVDAYLVERVHAATARPAGSDSFVGREEEVALLVRLIDQAVAGRGSIVTVLGEAGIGKSRLVDEAVAVSASRHPDLTIARTSVSSYESGIAYAPIRRMLGELAALGDLDDHLRSVPVERAALVREARAALERDGAGTTDAESMRIALAESVGAVLRANGALLVVIDDLHWADAASVHLLTAAFPLAERRPLAIVLVMRPEPSSAAWAIRHLAETEFPHRHTDLRVGPLADADARRVLRSIDEETPGELVATLVERAAGNPFFLEELARELTEEAGAGGRVPATLQRLMQARFDRMSTAARLTLEIAAVAGERVTEDLLEEITGRPVDEDLHELMRAGLLTPDPGETRTYRFVHSLARESAYQSIPRRRRREMHGSVGAVLELEEDIAPALLAFQFREAGDLPRALRYGFLAAEEASRLGAFVDACRHYDDALAIAPERDPLVVRLLLGRGRSRDVTGDIDGAISDLEQALQLVSDDDELEWHIRVATGEAWAARDYDRTGDQFIAALDVARRTGLDSMVGTSLNRLGNWYANAVDPEQAVGLHTEALTLFERIGSASGKAATHDLLGMAGLIGGDLRRAHANFLMAVDEFRHLEDVRGTIGALVGAAIGAPTYQNIDVPFVEPSDALQRLDEAVATARSIGWASGETFALFMRSQVRASTGSLGEGMADARTALETARRIGHHQWEVAALMCLSAAAGDALDVAVARTSAADAVTRATGVGSLNWLLEAAAVAARSAIEIGRTDEAEEILARALNRRGVERFGARRNCVAMQAWAAASRGEGRTALSLLDGLGESSPLLAYIRGKAAEQFGDTATALSQFEFGAASAERWGMVPMAWRLHLAAVGAGGGEGHLRSAADHLSRCADSLDTAEAARFRIAAERMLESRRERGRNERDL
jgi:class 3 adenylate cyclase/tetratricopeptide (TPR) repeat protein